MTDFKTDSQESDDNGASAITEKPISAESKERLINNFAKAVQFRRIKNSIIVDAIKDEKRLPHAVRNGLLSNAIGRVNAKPIALKTEMHDIIRQNMVSLIRQKSEPIYMISKALGIRLSFSENGDLCDEQKNGTSGLDKLVHKLQNPPGKIHPLFELLDSLKQPR